MGKFAENLNLGKRVLPPLFKRGQVVHVLTMANYLPYIRPALNVQNFHLLTKSQ